jgi:hypothetical protein
VTRVGANKEALRRPVGPSALGGPAPFHEHGYARRHRSSTVWNAQRADPLGLCRSAAAIPLSPEPVDDADQEREPENLQGCAHGASRAQVCISCAVHGERSLGSSWSGSRRRTRAGRGGPLPAPLPAVADERTGPAGSPERRLRPVSLGLPGGGRWLRACRALCQCVPRVCRPDRITSPIGYSEMRNDSSCRRCRGELAEQSIDRKLAGALPSLTMRKA